MGRHSELIWHLSIVWQSKMWRMNYVYNLALIVGLDRIEIPRTYPVGSGRMAALLIMDLIIAEVSIHGKEANRIIGTGLAKNVQKYTMSIRHGMMYHVVRSNTLCAMLSAELSRVRIQSIRISNAKARTLIFCAILSVQSRRARQSVMS